MLLALNAEIVRQGGKERIIFYCHDLIEEKGILVPKVTTLESNTITILGENPFTKKIETISPFAISLPVNNPLDYEDLLAKLKADARFDDLEFEILEKEKRKNLDSENSMIKYYLVTKGDSKAINQLPKRFILGNSNKLNNQEYKNKNSVKIWIEKELNLPLTILKNDKKDVFSVFNRLSFEDFLKLKTYSLDSEFMFWERKIELGDLLNTNEEIINFLEKNGGNITSSRNNQVLNKKEIKKELIQEVERYFNNNLGEGKKYFRKPATIQIGEKTDEGIKIHYFQHLINSEKDKEERKIILENGNAVLDYYNCNGSLNLVNTFMNFMNKNPCSLIISQNGMSYDLLELREYIQREQKIQKEEFKKNSKKNKRTGKKEIKEKINDFNIFGFPVRIEGTGGFFKKVVCNSVMHIDMAPYSQNYFPFTIDNKFGTIVSLISGKRFVKKEGYNDLTQRTIEQTISPRVFDDRFEKYACEDVSMINEIEQYLKTMVYLKANLFNRGVEDVCVTSKRNLAKQEYELKYSLKNWDKIKWRKEAIKSYNNFSSFELFLNLAEISDKQSNENNLRNLKTRKIRKKEDATMYYLSPFTRLYYDNLKKSDSAGKIINYLDELKIQDEESSNQKTLARFDLINTLEQGYLLPYLFRDKNKIIQKKFNLQNEKLEELISSFNSLITQFKPLANSDNFYCFSKENSENPKFKETIKKIGDKVAEGQLLVFRNHSFVLNDGVNLYKKELDCKGNGGFKTIYQKEMIPEIISRFFKYGEENVKDYAINFIDNINENNLNKEKMINFKEEITKDYEDYSSYAQRQKRIQAYIEFSMNKGEKFAKVNLSDGWKDIQEFLYMNDEEVYSYDNKKTIIEDYFGPIVKNLRTKKEQVNFSQGKIGKYLLPLGKEYLNEIESKVFKVLNIQKTVDSIFSIDNLQNSLF